METPTLTQIQLSYERYESHPGLKAINAAIEKVLLTGKKRYELPNGNFASQWINSVHEGIYLELVESRRSIIEREFSDIKTLLLNQ